MMVHEDSAPEPSVGPESDEAVQAELWALLDALVVEQRVAFLLHHVEGMSYDDMAVVTGVGVSALKMRVKRAGDVLRAKMLEVYRA
jgi:RNA polymerase sigma-70 factor (ECF subfamily)